MKDFDCKDVTVLLASAGSGKALRNDARVYTPRGYSKISSLKVYDEVLDGEGNKCQVLGVYPQGVKQMYRIHFSDRTHLDVCEEHINVVQRYNQGKKCKEYFNVNAKELIKLLEESRYSIRVDVPIVGGLEYRKVPIDPYLLGLLIGDGGTSKKSLSFSNSEKDLLLAIEKLLEEHYLGLRRIDKDKHDYTLVSKEVGAKKAFKEKLEKLGLNCKSIEKHIPKEYIYNSVENRIQLLRGLIDTDGYIDKEGSIEFSTSSKRLSKDFCELCRSLGIRVTVGEKQGKYTKGGKVIVCNTSYRHYLKVPNHIKIGSSKKFLARWKERQTEPIRKVVRVEKIGKEGCTCIRVSSPLHTFLTDNFTPTHNTFWLINKIEEELKTYLPSEISFVTYTRKGVQEGVERVSRDLSIPKASLAWFKTLHAYTYQLMGYESENIYNKFHERELNKLTGLTLNSTEKDKKGLAASTGWNQTIHTKMLELYSLKRNGVTGLFESEEAYDSFEYERVVSTYESFKKSKGLIDFNDCIINYLKEGKSTDVKVAFIDEAQDLSPVQWEVCRKLFKNAEKIYIAGDDFQTIFGYAGAKAATLVELSEKYKTIKLDKTYRLSRQVHSFSEKVIDKLGEKVDKNVTPVRDVEGTVKKLSSIDNLVSSISLPRKELEHTFWYILVRNNCFARSVTDELEKRCIPYWDTEGFFIPLRTLNTLKKYFSFQQSGYKSETKRKEFMEKYSVEAFSDSVLGLSFVDPKKAVIIQSYIDKWGIEKILDWAKGKPIILVTTVHRVKGGEAENVAYILDCTKKTFEGRYSNLDEELRVLYVASTRARKNLYFVPSSSEFGLDMLVDNL